MGPWGIALALLLGATMTEGGRKALRNATKQVIKAGYQLSDKSSSVIGELKEKTNDMIAEVRAEQSDGDGESEPTKRETKRKKAVVEET
jgi:hypothetical protein